MDQVLFVNNFHCMVDIRADIFVQTVWIWHSLRYGWHMKGNKKETWDYILLHFNVNNLNQIS